MALDHFKLHFSQFIQAGGVDAAFLQNHHLEALCYSQWHRSEFKSAWTKNFYRNNQLYEELANIDQNLEVDFPIYLLKGANTTKRIYDNIGERFFSDIDLYMHSSYFHLLKRQLKWLGYVEVLEKKWKANDFKTVFIKNSKDLEVILEVHTQLFWTQRDNFLQGQKMTPFIHFYYLESHLEFLHLCTHLAFQHSYLSLHWLYEIGIYYSKFKNQIHLDRVLKLAKRNKVKNSLYSVVWVLKYKFKFDIELEIPENLDYLFSKLFTDSFLKNPKSQPFKYLCLKHLLKDDIKDNVRYNLGWIFGK